MSPEAEPASFPSTARDPRGAEFEILTRDLRGALEPYTAPPRVWVPEDERRDFRVLLVDKGARLPVRKLSPEQGGHSPLSPLTPTSPLYPDGLIAPVWVRKHTELVPSVFVLFLRLYETPSRSSSASPLGGEVLSEGERQTQREADDATVREIADRRRRLGERGIKLTVVLMATAATLDADGLDQRLSAIRRASQLSAKASLFVLTPVKASELPDFVRSLMGALYDPAMEYYAAHGKRVRRKRGRVPSSGPMPASGTRSRSGSIAGGGRSRSGSVVHGHPLTAQGWMIRYDWKAGWSAEVRGELDLARRHYEDCWNELARMFGSTSTLPPRTKRWAEAKVLADCLAVRICKLQLYENAANKVLVPFFVHLRRFADLSRGWGIGEDTFEFWSWVARQYRIFGEILEIAQTNGFDIPPMPQPIYPPAPANLLPPAADELTMPVSTTNPLHVLQPPAFYFYTAASCTIERKARYESALASERASGSSGLSSAPGFANEKKVDHTALIVDLLRKATLLLENGRDEQSLVLYASFRMAEAQACAGQYDAATKTLNALSERFEPEAWRPLAARLRALWYECAQATGDVEMAVRLLAEMLADTEPSGHEEHGTLQDDLLSLLTTAKPSSDEPINLESALLLDVRGGFRRAEAATHASVPFQLAISSPAGVDISRLAFSRLRVALSDGSEIVVSHEDGSGSRRVDLGAVSGTVEVSAPLTFAEPLILTGSLSSAVPADLEVEGATLTLARHGWVLSWPLDVSSLNAWTGVRGTYVPLDGIYSSVSVAARAHLLSVELEHAPVGFVGEALPITVRVRSEDERKLKLSMSVLLQPGDEPDGESFHHYIQCTLLSSSFCLSSLCCRS